MSKKVAQIQEQINNNALDTDSLSQQQLQALDNGFKTGVLTGYDSVNDLIRFRQRGKAELASKIETAEETVPGVNLPVLGEVLTTRGSYETFADATGAFAMYAVDRQKLIDAFVQSGGKQTFAPNYRAGFSPTVAKLSKFLENAPLVKRFGLPGRLFARTVGVLENAANKTIDASRLGLTQVAKTELKSVAAGALGGAGGSVAFDVVNNFDKDFAAQATYDLADLSEKEIDQQDPLTRTMIHAIDAFRNSLLWAGGTSALVQSASILAKAFAKGLTGTGKNSNAKEIGESALKYGVDLNIGQVAKRGAGLAGGQSKDFFETIGIYPGVAKQARKDRIESEKRLTSGMFKFAENLSPIHTSRILGYQAMDVLNNNYRQFQNMIDEGFKTLKNEALEFGNPNMIPVDNIRAAAKNLEDDMNLYNLDELKIDEIESLRKGQFKMKPVNALLLKFADQGVFSDKSFIKPTEYMFLKEELNRAIKESPNSKSIIRAATEMRAAMDKDFASVGDSSMIHRILNDSPDFQGLNRQQFNEAKEKLNMFGENLRAQFHSFSALTDPFNSMTAKELQKFGDYLFTAKSLLGIPGTAKGKDFYPSRMFDKTITSIIKNGAPEAIDELSFLVGATDKGLAQKTGRAFMDRLGSRFLYDAFYSAFQTRPQDAGLIEENIIKQLQDQGMVRTVFKDEILQRTGTEDLLSQRTIKGAKSIDANVGVIKGDFIEKQIDPAVLGDFKGVDSIRQNLGFIDQNGNVDSLGKERLSKVFGGGKRGKEVVDNIDNFLDVIDQYYSQNIGDSSRYANRRIQLTGITLGAGAVAGFMGAPMVGMGVAGLVLMPMLLRGFGSLLSNPKYAKALLDLYTPEERIAKLGKGGLQDFPFVSMTQPFGKYLSPNKRRSLGILLPSFADEDDEVKIDVDKITAEQLMDYLNSKKTKIPDTTFRTKYLPEANLKRMFPDVYLYQNASVEDKAKYDELLKGTNIASAKNVEIQNADEIDQMNFENARANEMQTQMQEQNQTASQVKQNQTQPSMQTAMFDPNTNRQGVYKALFPDDDIGELLATRGIQRG